MSPEIASVVMPVSTLLIIFAVYSSSIYLAKRNMREWKKYTTIFFLRKSGSLNIRRSASLWMQKFGYDEEDAWRLAVHQSVAGFGSFFIGVIWFAIASNITTR
jgi:hypothetical protein